MSKIVSTFKFFLNLISKSKYLTKAARHAFHKTNKFDGNFFYYENNDLSFLLHRNETISNSIFLDGEFEFSKFIKALKFINKNDRTLIDVGANIGSITIPALKKNFFKNAIVFEPNPESLKLLKVNILINKLEKKVKLYDIALTNKKTIMTLKSDLKLNRGDNRLINTKKIGKNFFRVKTDLLDNFTQKFNRANSLIKIDVQGEESVILFSAKKTLSKKIPIIIEFEPSNLKKNWKKNFIHIFAYYKYFYDLKDPRPTKKINTSNNLEKLYQDYFDKKSFTDVLFI